jgi:hypothetical protein
MGFDPVSLGLIGAAVSAGGSVMGGLSQASASHYQAEVARNNAQTEAQNASHASAATADAAEQQSLKGANRQAAVKGALAANGVDVNSGSAVNVEASDREQAKLDTLNTESNGQQQVYGYRVQSGNFNAQSGLDQQQADQAPVGAAFGALGSLASNASAIGFKTKNLANLFTTS